MAGGLFGTSTSLLSPAYIVHESVSCRSLLRHRARLAVPLALASAGNNMLARIPMMAMTTNSSISVNPVRGRKLLTTRRNMDLASCKNKLARHIFIKRFPMRLPQKTNPVASALCDRIFGGDGPSAEEALLARPLTCRHNIRHAKVFFLAAEIAR